MRYILIPLICAALGTQAGIPEIPYTTFKYTPATCQNLNSPSGSQIFIPEHAFVAEDGSVCDENITIKYREFHSQADMVIGNIPMNFMQGKIEHQLESAGMFEIYADCDGTPLKLAPNKKINIRFASRQEIGGMSAFYFQNGGWRLLTTPVVDMGSDPGNRYNQALWGDAPPQVNIGSQNPEGGWGEEYYISMDTYPWVGIDSVIYGYAPVIKPPVRFMGMDIAAMGLYNYDRTLSDSNSIPFVADFKLKGKKESLTSKVYVTYSGINTVVYFTPEEWSEKFSLLARKDIKMFCMLPDGRVAVLQPADLEKLDIRKLKGKKHTFELEVGNIKPETKDQLASVAGIEP
jgi:hypothetical protein